MSVFLKWVGGKRCLISQYEPLLPRRYRDYYEPFLGAGSLFFQLSPRRAYLSDRNTRLVDTFRAVRQDAEGVITRLQRYKEAHSKELYYLLRDRLNAASDWLLDRAALFIYLNATGYNGLYRENQRGHYNVPFGRSSFPAGKEDSIRQASVALQRARLASVDFRPALHGAGEGDLVFLDPPYHPLDGKDSFSAYQGAGFSEEDHEDLASLVEDLHARGCFVMLSNSCSSRTREQYYRWRFSLMWRGGSLNSNTADRGKVREALITNY